MYRSPGYQVLQVPKCTHRGINASRHVGTEQSHAVPSSTLGQPAQPCPALEPRSRPHLACSSPIQLSHPVSCRCFGCSQCFPPFLVFTPRWRFHHGPCLSGHCGGYTRGRGFRQGEVFCPNPAHFPIPDPSYPPQPSCLSPPGHLPRKPTLLPSNLCFYPECYLHTSPDNQRACNTSVFQYF